jgi:hypothetical protein
MSRLESSTVTVDSAHALRPGVGVCGDAGGEAHTSAGSKGVGRLLDANKELRGRKSLKGGWAAHHPEE